MKSLFSTLGALVLSRSLVAAGLEFYPVAGNNELPASSTLNVVASSPGMTIVAGVNGALGWLQVTNDSVSVVRFDGIPATNFFSLAYSPIQRAFVAGGSGGSLFWGAVTDGEGQGTVVSWLRIANALPESVSENNPILGVTAFNSQFLTAPEVGAVFRGADVAPWERTSSLDSTQFRVSRGISGVSPTVAVLVGENELIRVSADAGLNWRQVRLYSNPQQPLGTNLYAVTAHEGAGLAVGGSGTILFNPGLATNPTDPSGWSQVSAPTGADLRSVIRAAGVFVAVGSDGTILTSATGSGDWTQATSSSLIPSTTVFNSVSYSAEGPLAGLVTVVGSNATNVVALGGIAPTVPRVDWTSQTNCYSGASYTVTATVDNPATTTVDWYGSPENGEPLEDGRGTLTYTFQSPPNADATYVVYAQSRDARVPQLISTNRQRVELIIRALPVQAVVENPIRSDCYKPGGSIYRFAVTNVVSPITVDWFDAPMGGTLLLPNSTNYSFTNPGPGSYRVWAETRNLDTGCVSSNRTEAQLIILPLPPVAEVAKPFETNCFSPGGAVDVFTVANVAPPVVVDWYSAPLNGIRLVTNSATFSITNAAPGVYTAWAETRNANTGCISSNRTEIRLVVNPLPPVARVAVAAQTNCYQPQGAQYAFTVTNAVAPVTVDWYATGSGGTPLLVGGTSYSLTNPTPGTYTAWAQTRNTATGCVSSNRTEVRLVIQPLPPVAVVPDAVRTECYALNHPQYAFTVSNVGPSETVDWYSAQTGGTLVTNSPTYLILNPGPGTYTAWAQTRNTGTGCVSSNRTEIRLTILPLPQVALKSDAVTQLLVGQPPVQLSTLLQINPSDPGATLMFRTNQVVVKDGLFDPSLAPLGVNPVAYEYTDSVSCGVDGAFDLIVSEVAVTLEPSGRVKLSWFGAAPLLGADSLSTPVPWPQIAPGVAGQVNTLEVEPASTSRYYSRGPQE